MSPRLMLPRLFATLLSAPFVLGCCIFGASVGAKSAENVFPPDRAALAACLELVKKNEAARSSDEPMEKPGPEGRLAAARTEAPRRADSCIGAVSTTCLQYGGNESTAARRECYGREVAAWDALLNTAFKAALAQADGQDAADGLRKTQRNWIAFRDAACAQPALAYRGTMAGPMSAACVMELTARQTLWLENWLH
jgi:uncharacterized protein YecT (DUF1311 family)